MLVTSLMKVDGPGPPLPSEASLSREFVSFSPQGPARTHVFYQGENGPGVFSIVVGAGHSLQALQLTPPPTVDRPKGMNGQERLKPRWRSKARLEHANQNPQGSLLIAAPVETCELLADVAQGACAQSVEGVTKGALEVFVLKEWNGLSLDLPNDAAVEIGGWYLL